MVMVLRHDRARSGLELLGHCPHLGEQLGHAAGDVVDPGQELGTYASGIGTSLPVSRGPAASIGAAPTCESSSESSRLDTLG
jgi:hypothetical protein